ncbi:MAG: LD-carboxypeptidase [Bacteroidota bacterium]
MLKTKRQFVKQIALGSISLPYLMGNGINRLDVDFSNTKPSYLTPGDTIALVSPSAAVYENEPVDIAVEAQEKFGLKVKVSPYLRSRYGHLGGTDHERASEINETFKDPNIKAIICLRGGSGAARILDKLDYKVIRKNPKIFLGYSDVTAFQIAIYAKTQLTTFHGPVGVSSWDSFSREYYSNLIFHNKLVHYKNPPKSNSDWVDTKNRIRTIQPGITSGKLIGGNLTVLCGLLGSDYVPDFKGSILFLEEVNEALYRVDRLMSQLQLAGVLKDIKGFIFGKCTNCDPDRGYGSLTFDEIIDHYIKPLGIPAFSGSMIGHIKSKFTVPIGVKAEMNADEGSFKLLEHALAD